MIMFSTAENRKVLALIKQFECKQSADLKSGWKRLTVEDVAPQKPKFENHQAPWPSSKTVVHDVVKKNVADFERIFARNSGIQKNMRNDKDKNASQYNDDDDDDSSSSMHGDECFFSATSLKATYPPQTDNSILRCVENYYMDIPPLILNESQSDGSECDNNINRYEDGVDAESFISANSSTSVTSDKLIHENNGAMNENYEGLCELFSELPNGTCDQLETSEIISECLGDLCEQFRETSWKDHESDIPTIQEQANRIIEYNKHVEVLFQKLYDSYQVDDDVSTKFAQVFQGIFLNREEDFQMSVAAFDTLCNS